MSDYQNIWGEESQVQIRVGFEGNSFNQKYVVTIPSEASTLCSSYKEGHNMFCGTFHQRWL